MFGIREITIGLGLFLAKRSAPRKRGIPRLEEVGREEVRRGIWLNVLTDGLDLVFLGGLFLSGESVGGVVLGRMAVEAVGMLGAGSAWLYE